MPKHALGGQPCTSLAGCLENFSRCRCRHRFKLHTIPQAFNPPGEPIDGKLPPPFVKILGPQFTILFIAREHVKDTTHHGVRHGNDGPFLPPADGEALIEGRQIRVLGGSVAKLPFGGRIRKWDLGRSMTWGPQLSCFR
jgi:hypothetical protein